MSVILKPEDYAQWLNPKVNGNEKSQKLLAPYPAMEMSSHAVSISEHIAKTPTTGNLPVSPISLICRVVCSEWRGGSIKLFV